jgi:hypothetical protein
VDEFNRAKEEYSEKEKRKMLLKKTLTSSIKFSQT